MITKKWRLLGVLLLSIGLLFVLLEIGRINTYKRYIKEDTHQFINEMNHANTKSKMTMDTFFLENEEVSIDENDVRIFTIYHQHLERSIFDFKKKSPFIDEKIDNDFQELFDKYHFNEEINVQDIRLYFEELSERLDEKEEIVLNDHDENMFQSILDFYQSIRKDVNKVIKDIK